MIWDLPVDVEIDGYKHKIRNNCDFRVILDVIEALNDEELEMEQRVQCALFIFYEDISKIKDFEFAVKKMMEIIDNGEEKAEQEETSNGTRLMDWMHDFKNIAPAVSRVLGYDVRTPEKYTHWWTFVGAYMEIGECMFSTIVSIRSKLKKGKKLEDWEREFYTANKKQVDLPQKLSKEEKEYLDFD